MDAFVDLAERAGAHRSTVGRAFQPGGPLYPALVSEGRGDQSHPCVVRWLKEHGVRFPAPRSVSPNALPPDFAERAGLRGLSEPSYVLVRETAITVEQAAAEKGVPVSEVLSALDGELAQALVPPGHVAADEFAARAEVPIGTVVEAARAGELAPALLESGRLDLGHPAALAFMAARPFRRLKNGDPACPTINGDGFLVPACVGDDIDMNHPVALAWCARLDGRVPSSSAA